MMITSNHLASILLSFVLIQVFSATEVNAQSKADKLRAIERERLRTLVNADIPTASRLHADDFELIDPRGGTHSKEQYLRSIASGDLNYLEWEPGAIRFRLYGKSAVLRYQAHLRVSIKGSAGSTAIPLPTSATPGASPPWCRMADTWTAQRSMRCWPTPNGWREAASTTKFIGRGPGGR